MNLAHHKRWRTTEAVQRRAKELRRTQTPAEKRLWAALRRKQLYGLKFRRQHPIGTFIVDFCVEIDGDSHGDRAEYDRECTLWLEERGYTVVRFTNEEVYHHPDPVLDEIARQCGVPE